MAETNIIEIDVVADPENHESKCTAYCHIKEDTAANIAHDVAVNLIRSLMFEALNDPDSARSFVPVDDAIDEEVTQRIEIVSNAERLEMRVAPGKLLSNDTAKLDFMLMAAINVLKTSSMLGERYAAYMATHPDANKN